MTTDQWYVLDQSGTSSMTRGPYVLEQIRQLVRESTLNAETQVAHPGDETWRPASEDPILAELFGSAAALTPPTVPSVPTGSIWGPLDDHASFSGEFSIRSMLSLAVVVFKQNYLQLLACVVLVAVLSVPMYVLNGMGRMLAGGGWPTGTAALLVLLAIAYGVLVSPAIGPGLYWCGVKAIRGNAGISDVFGVYRRFLDLLGTQILWILVAFGASILFYISLLVAFLIASLVVGSPGFLVAAIIGLPIVVIGVILIIRMSVAVVLSMILVCDPTVQVRGGGDAMRVGWRLAGHRRSRVSYGLFVAALLLVLSAFLFCIGYLFLGMPFFVAAVAATYEMMRRSPSFEGYLGRSRV